MSIIEIIFPDSLPEIEVVRRLSRADSGFEPDDRRPLDSSVVDGFTIAGVVLDAASLGTAIWALKIQLAQHASNGSEPSKSIQIRSRGGQAVPLPPGDVHAIVRALEEMTRGRGNNEDDVGRR